MAIVLVSLNWLFFSNPGSTCNPECGVNRNMVLGSYDCAERRRFESPLNLEEASIDISLSSSSLQDFRLSFLVDS